MEYKVLKLIKGGQIYNPEFLGKMDILIAGDMIIKVADKIPLPREDFYEMMVIDAEDSLIVPGFIDGHVHLTGGGGEGGFKTRTPEIQLSQLINAGITTAVGVLGTDATTRNITGLLAKARALEEEGISTYIYTGSYQIPLQTITGNCRDDIIIIDKIIGVGEIALADSRSSQPTLEEFKKITALARTGGMLSGKAGLVHVHLGDGDPGLGYLLKIVEKTEIPITQFLPTHVNRNPYLLESAIEFIKKGGVVDLTTSSSPNNPDEIAIPASRAAAILMDRGVNIEAITFSSDGMGSLPVFNEKGVFTGLGIGSVSSLFQEVRKMVTEMDLSLSSALKCITCNMARILKLGDRGYIKTGHRADLVFLTNDLQINSVISGGKIMMTEGEIIVKGTFEK